MGKAVAKPISKKHVTYSSVWSDSTWTVVAGQLRSRGRPRKIRHLFTCIAEKLPFASLARVQRVLKNEKIEAKGVYMAHDSIGVARYGGRGDIFTRLRSHRRKYGLQLPYFSFYIVDNKHHEREIENAILRASGGQMIFNQRKRGDGIYPGRVTDYEAGSYFFERQGKRGKRLKSKRVHS